jgi:putative redox protein
MIELNWLGKMAFEATPPTGNKFVMDAYPESGGENLGPSPLEAFVAGAAGCSAMDVIHILKAKRQKVTRYRVEVDGERDSEGPYPRPYRSLTVRHFVEGEDLNPEFVRQAVEMSDQKYCSAIATLRAAPTVTSEFEVIAAPVTAGSN